MNALQKVEQYRADDRLAAEAILERERYYGGPDASLVKWARGTLEQVLAERKTK